MKLICLIALVVTFATDVLAQTNLYAAVGYGGRRISSTDGRHWENDQRWSEVTADDDNVLFNIAYGRGKFVAVGGATKVGHIMVTRDGKGWTEPQTYKSRIATINFGHDRFVAMKGSEFLWSPDGERWTNGAKIPFSGGMHPRKSAFGNGVFVTVGDCDPSWKFRTRFRAVTRDGTSVEHFTTNQPPEQAIAFGAGRFVVVGKDGLRESSTDGIRWEHRANEPGENLGSILWTGKQFIVGGGKSAYTSTDGITWTREDKRIPCTMLAGHGTVFVGASWGGHLWHSTNGLDWAKASVAAQNSFEAVAVNIPGP